MPRKTVAKMIASRAARKEKLGPSTNSRKTESDAPSEINDTYGSTGRRKYPKFDTSDKP